MNKLFTKAAKILLGLSLAAGVGVAVSNRSKVSRVDAATANGSATKSGSTFTTNSSNWDSSGTGTYTTGVKFDSTGDKVYKSDLFSRRAH